MSRLSEATWLDVSRGGCLVVPVGATEQHGPNLPLGTDTCIVEAIVGRFEAGRPEVWIAPTIKVGASGEHADFPGTLSLGREVLTEALVEIGRSADHFECVYFVNWHGGNVTAIGEAVETLAAEGRRAGRWLPIPDGLADVGDLHAGRKETSLMLAIRPDLVRTVSDEAGPRIDSPELMLRLKTEGVKAVSPCGVLGDPAGAGVPEGCRLLEEFSGHLIASFDEFVAAGG